jgi:hypothetical protein
MRKRLARAAAWVVTAGLLVFLFKSIRPADVLAATRSAAGWTVPGILACSLAVYFADSFATWKTFGWFLAPLTFGQVLVVRGATYLLAAINYNIGQGAIVYFVKRAFGVPIVKGIATVLLVMGVNVLALLFLATAGLWVAPEVPGYAKPIVGVAWAGLCIYALAVSLKPRVLAGRPVLNVLLTAGLGGHVKALAVRVPHIAALVAYQFTAMHGFHVDVPLGQAIVALPIVFFVAVLPISVQGLGVMQATLVFFFARYAPGDEATQKATVLAASLTAQAVATSFQILLGLACLRTSVGKQLKSAANAATAETPTAETAAPSPGPSGG